MRSPGPVPQWAESHFALSQPWKLPLPLHASHPSQSVVTQQAPVCCESESTLGQLSEFEERINEHEASIHGEAHARSLRKELTRRTEEAPVVPRDSPGLPLPQHAYQPLQSALAPESPHAPTVSQQIPASSRDPPGSDVTCSTPPVPCCAPSPRDPPGIHVTGGRGVREHVFIELWAGDGGLTLAAAKRGFACMPPIDFPPPCGV